MFRRVLSLSLVILVAFAALPAVQGVTTSDVIVGFHGAVDEPAIEQMGGRVLRTSPGMGIALVRTPDVPSFVLAAAASPAIAFVETNDRLRLAASSWDASSWDASSWDASSWDASSWDASSWDASSWDASSWDASSWDASSWDASSWDASSWDASSWDASSWDASSWDASSWDYGTVDPGYAWQWGLGAANFPDAWKTHFGSRGVKVCVLDTGVDDTHGDLRPSLWRAADGHYGYNAMAPGTAPQDDVGHGTHVAGILAAVAGNGTGVAGAARVTVMTVKVMDANGGTESDLVHGIDFCLTNGARAVSMSLHIDKHSEAVHRAVQKAQERNVLVVAAAGNSGVDQVALPAAYPGVIAVGAVKADGTLAGFSNHGANLALVAPGYRIASTFPGDSYAMGSGTSMAVPFVTAAAGLVWSVQDGWTAKEVAGALLSTARDFGEAGKDPIYGHGALNAGAAVQAAAST